MQSRFVGKKSLLALSLLGLVGSYQVKAECSSCRGIIRFWIGRLVIAGK
jgi:hypothetical protein